MRSAVRRGEGRGGTVVVDERSFFKAGMEPLFPSFSFISFFRFPCFSLLLFSCTFSFVFLSLHLFRGISIPPF